LLARLAVIAGERHVHFGPAARDSPRFIDDYYLPERLRGLGDGPLTVVERRRVVVPPDARPGSYRLVVGVCDPASRHRLRRWLGGVIPTFGHAVELATGQVLPPGGAAR
jgi:hypothetical protein